MNKSVFSNLHKTFNFQRKIISYKETNEEVSYSGPVHSSRDQKEQKKFQSTKIPRGLPHYLKTFAQVEISKRTRHEVSRVHRTFPVRRSALEQKNRNFLKRRELCLCVPLRLVSVIQIFKQTKRLIRK